MAINHVKAGVRMVILFERPKKSNRNRFPLLQSKSTYLTLSLEICQLVDICYVNCATHKCELRAFNSIITTGFFGFFPPVNI